MPVTFGFLQYGQIQPPSIVFAELKLSGLFGLHYVTEGRTETTNHKPLQLS